MTWRDFVKHIRRLTRLITFSLIANFLILALSLGSHQGDVLPDEVTLVLMAALLVLLWQSIRRLSMISSFMRAMEPPPADKGGLLIPYPEQDTGSRALPEVAATTPLALATVSPAHGGTSDSH